MNKAWLGYVSSALLLLAGVLMIVAQKPIVGALFILLAVVGLVLRIYMSKNQQ